MEERKSKKDRYIGIGFLVFSLVTYFLIIPSQIYVPFRTKGTVLSPAFFPRIILGVLALLSFLLIVNPPPKKAIVFKDKVGSLNFFRVWGIVFLFIVYIFVLIPIFGFLPGSMIFLISLMRYAGIRDWKKIIGVSVGIPMVFFYIFKLWAGIVFPRGVFFG